MLNATDFVVPALEILDTRVERVDAATKATRKIYDTIADNAANAGIVLGPPVADWRRLDLAALGGRLAINGKEIGRGVGADALGHPLNALAWLANRRAGEGNPLRRGQVVMTGSVMKTIFPDQDAHYRFDVEGLGSVEVRVSA